MRATPEVISTEDLSLRLYSSMFELLQFFAKGTPTVTKTRSQMDAKRMTNYERLFPLSFCFYIKSML